MTKVDEFFEWIESNQRSLKNEDHEELSQKFDPDCEVDQYCDRGDEGCPYGIKTEVIFSDGSVTVFNYKGEEV